MRLDRSEDVSVLQTRRLNIRLRDRKPRNNTKSVNIDNTTMNILEDKPKDQDLATIYTSKKVLMCLSQRLFQTISHIVHLNLSNNGLDDLPRYLSFLKHLEHLDVSDNTFTKFPYVICELKSLRMLKAQKNNLSEIPNDFEGLTNLRYLDLSSNLLYDLPTGCSSFRYLRELLLANNKFKRIPRCVANGMQNLRVLDFSRNANAEVNIAPRSGRLTAFYAEQMSTCCSFPSWILSARYFDLQIVKLDETQFENFQFPKQVTKSRIEQLSIAQGNFSGATLQNMLSKMDNLRDLNIKNTKPRQKGNFFLSLPVQTLRNPAHITNINAAFTGISSIPGAIGDFTNLTSLDVSENNISWLPREFCELKSLERLLIDHNDLVMLPEEIGSITSLRELKLSFNKLTKLPASMKHLKNLQFLDLYDNEFLSFPETIVELELIGLDLEQNIFPTDDETIVRIGYKRMLTALRTHWSRLNKYIDGAKIDPYEYRERDEECSEQSDNDDVPYESDQVVLPSSINDERWDISEDSADEFDPHEQREPRWRCCSPLPYYESLKQNIFCPADNHETQVRTRIKEMLETGLLVWISKYEDGQFDDP